jgi:hypothetical protein
MCVRCAARSFNSQRKPGEGAARRATMRARPAPNVFDESA